MALYYSGHWRRPAGVDPRPAIRDDTTKALAQRKDALRYFPENTHNPGFARRELAHALGLTTKWRNSHRRRAVIGGV